MTRHNHFVIRNDFSKSLMLNIEPEGHFFLLAQGEEVAVHDECMAAPVTLKLTASEKGEPIVSLWPGDGEIRVEKDGINVFDLVQERARV